MLVLSRKEKERILITDPEGRFEQIVITICRIDHGKVRIGIEAEKRINIIREELKPNQ